MKETKKCTVTLVIREVIIYLLAFTIKLKVTSAFIDPLDGSVLRRAAKENTGKYKIISQKQNRESNEDDSLSPK